MDFIRAQSAKEALTEQLPMTKNVIGAGVGLKYVNGKATSEPAVVVFVEKKYRGDELIKQSDIEFIPSKIDGIQTDVIEVGKIVPQIGLRSMCRPLIPGVSVGHKSITAGTLGGFFLDNDNDLIILSNNHVLANENSAAAGDEIVQPGPMDANGNLSRIATLKAFNKIGPNNNHHDSAIARVEDNFKNNGGINVFYPSLNRCLTGWGGAAVQMPVQKVGRTTGYTNGRIIATHATFTIGYGFGPATFVDCIVCTNMSAGGDSGSIILDMDMNAVGLLFAGSGKVTLATPIDKVRDHYGLKMYQNTAVKSTVSLDLEQWPDLLDKPVTLYDKTWRSVDGNGKTELFDSHLEITAKANTPCYWEHEITTPFDLARVTIKRCGDEGETFGPGMAIIWTNGFIKMNLQANGEVCATVNKLQYTVETIGEERVSMRIKKEGKMLCGEYLREGMWVTVMCVPASIVEGEPKLIRVGKLDIDAGGDNNPNDGNENKCEISDLLYS